MSQLLQFFDSEPSSFGFFYPKDHVLLGFADLLAAQAAARKLEQGGYTERAHMVASGQEVLETYRELREDNDWMDRVKRLIAKGVGTEQSYVDDDIRLAENGGAFMIVQCQSQEEADSLQRFVREVRPVSARRYTAMTIETLD